MQFAQMNFLLPIRVQLLITVQNDDKNIYYDIIITLLMENVKKFSIKTSKSD